MEFLAKTEGERLTLYHLEQIFFHGERLSLSICAEKTNHSYRVTLSDKNESSFAEVLFQPSLHKSTKRAEKAALGLAFFKASRSLTEYLPPYGTLLGVRPVKVPLYYLEQGFCRDEVNSILTQEYAVNAEKAQHLIELAEKEQLLVKRLPERAAMLYLSIPFCPSRCSYCSFISSSAPEHLDKLDEYVELLRREILLNLKAMETDKKVPVSIYMGGGTPGILSAKQMKTLLEPVLASPLFGECKEFCVEIGRPDTVTKEKLELLAEAGVDRISINPQTTCNETLLKIGRRHSAEDFFRAMDLAAAYPFRTVNCDLIAGLGSETPSIFLSSLADLTERMPENITIHALCRKKSAQHRVVHSDAAAWQEAMREAYRMCIQKGYRSYYLYRQKEALADLENTGFALPGHECLYNTAMMEDLADIYACGAGAIGKTVPNKKGDKIRRFAQYKYPFEYLADPERAEKLLRERQEKIV